jgi:RimJ/RimL family protein N-acetyltransferase
LFKTERLFIRLMEEEDLEFLRIMHNDGETLKWLTDIFQVTKEEQHSWFLKMSTTRNVRRYVAIEKKSNYIIGVARLDEIDLVNKNAVIGVDIKLESRRQGFAYETYNCLIDYAFNSLNLHRLSLVTLENNVGARNLYLKLGFEEEGIRAEAILRDGKYINLICMYKLNSLK